MTHRADCTDCTWSFQDEDLVDVSEKMERHARKEQHHVDLERAVATAVRRDQDDEEFYVVDEDRGAVVAGPFEEKDEAAADARDRTPSHIVATKGVLDMMQRTSRATIRWENDDVDVVTDGGRDVQALYERALGTWGAAAQVDKATEECCELGAELARTQNGLGDEADLVKEIADAEIMLEQLRLVIDPSRIDAAREAKLDRLAERLDEAEGAVATDGGAARHWHRASANAARTHAGVGDQDATCVNGTPGCPGPNPSGGVLPCGPCFLSGGEAHAD
ncbi:nucleoside triphosphate pyrophosphohydrolase family protein [Halorarum salinum]|uniref:hypothetical protein n=1 Tax=Halorarum salinum TaxID=2743089 RepID=UPI001C52EA09|nr:hypothetical protein [Halobaculum salinum]